MNSFRCELFFSTMQKWIWPSSNAEQANQIRDLELSDDERQVPEAEYVRESFIASTEMDDPESEFYRASRIITVAMETQVNAIRALLSKQEVDAIPKALSLVGRMSKDPNFPQRNSALFEIISAIVKESTSLSVERQTLACQLAMEMNHFMSRTVAFSQIFPGESRKRIVDFISLNLPNVRREELEASLLNDFLEESFSGSDIGQGSENSAD